MTDWITEQVLASVREQALAGLEHAGEQLLLESQIQAPVDTGELHDSGDTEMVDDQTVKVAYTADHAISVHERVDVRHAVGKSKFLEDPANAFGDELMAILADYLEDALR